MRVCMHVCMYGLYVFMLVRHIICDMEFVGCAVIVSCFGSPKHCCCTLLMFCRSLRYVHSDKVMAHHVALANVQFQQRHTFLQSRRQQSTNISFLGAEQVAIYMRHIH
jgi:hypothetical protein